MRDNRPETAIVKNIGVDTGGTFTDIVMRINGDLWTHKVLSTPQNPAHAVIQGVREICGRGFYDPDVSTDTGTPVLKSSTDRLSQPTRSLNVEGRALPSLQRKVLKTF